jgi:hypothetical protein
VHDPESSEVDDLLMSSPEAAVKLKLRLFSEPYAIHRAAGKAQ